MIAVSSNLPAASTNAARTDSSTTSAPSGTAQRGKAVSFWSHLDGCLGDDSAGDPGVSNRRPSADDKQDRKDQSAVVTVAVVEVKPETPILDWGLPSRETAEAKSGSVAAARSASNYARASSAGSTLDVALPEEAPLQNPRADAAAADSASNLAFAARLVPSDAGATPQNAAPRDLPAVAPGKPTQTLPALQGNSQNPAATAVDQSADAADSAAAADSTEFAVAAVKAAAPGNETRDQNAHTGQPETNIAPADALPRKAEAETPAGAMAESKETAAARPVEPEQPPAPPVSHQVSLRLADGQSNVDIRMTERAGEIRVTVHTPEGNLANSMRNELPDLVGKLRQTGYHAEAWRPAPPAQTDGERRSGGDHSSQQQWTGARRDGRQQQQQQQQNKPRWVGEWNMSLGPGQESSK